MLVREVTMQPTVRVKASYWAMAALLFVGVNVTLIVYTPMCVFDDGLILIAFELLSVAKLVKDETGDEASDPSETNTYAKEIV